MAKNIKHKQTTFSEIPEPLISKLLFADTRFAVIWLVLRLYVGWEWVQAGWEKVTSPMWTGAHAGSALHGFLQAALVKSHGLHPDVASWYANFLASSVLPHTALFSFLVSFGELAVGIALILGLFTGIAAFFAGFMNMNYLFAGTISINPLLFLLELFLMLAWRVAGWYGLDRLILPLLGTPWMPGKLFRKSH